jgi:ferredoxin
MRVWIDQDLCTGDGLCVDHCNDVFTQLEDGIAYVTELGRPLNDPGSAGSLATVPSRHVTNVIHAAEACPGECIFIEIDDRVDATLDVEVDARIAARIEVL